MGETDLAAKRTVATFDRSGFERLHMDGCPPNQDTWWKVVSYDERSGQGSYLMIMGPGTVTNPHRHDGPEEWYMVEGDLVDNDGHVYRTGDFVSLAGGSVHNSHSPSGCKIVVTHRGPVVDLDTL
ncbi:MAG: cupin domain-containing protein [Pseudomonadota bacterium]